MEHLMNKNPSVALIGAGAIAPFHVGALRAAGFNLTDIAASPNSTRVVELAKRLHIENVWTDPVELISSGEWDAIVVASSTESIPGLLEVVLRCGKPCLVEKPVAFEGASILRFHDRYDNIRVAYNRRFYAATTAAKSFADQGKCLFRLELPDTANSPDGEFNGLRAIRENSVHGLDLLRHIIGPYGIEHQLAVEDPRGRVAIARTAAGHVGTIHLNWNCPANFSLVLDRAPHRFELRPFEMGSLYEGMDVLEPSPEVPVRRYVPKLISQVNSFPGPDGVKPGFLDQALSLMQRVRTGQWDVRTATLTEAAFAADLAQILTSD
jgi:hypothetical protein